MDKKTLVEAVPTQVVEMVHPGKVFEQTKAIRRLESVTTNFPKFILLPLLPLI